MLGQQLLLLIPSGRDRGLSTREFLLQPPHFVPKIQIILLHPRQVSLQGFSVGGRSSKRTFDPSVDDPIV